MQSIDSQFIRISACYYPVSYAMLFVVKKSYDFDVCCGENWKGNVNCDLDIAGGLGHRNESKKLKTRVIPNFLFCDAMHLPFRDNIFSVAISCHVIEHAHNPYLMFRELVRVSKREVVIKRPHRRGDPLNGKGKPWNKQHNINSFNQAWFRAMAKSLDLACEAKLTRYKFIPHEYIPLIQIPLEMTITILKPKPRTSLTKSIHHSHSVEPILDLQAGSSEVAVSLR